MTKVVNSQQVGPMGFSLPLPRLNIYKFANDWNLYYVWTPVPIVSTPLVTTEAKIERFDVHVEIFGHVFEKVLAPVDSAFDKVGQREYHLKYITPLQLGWLPDRDREARMFAKLRNAPKQNDNSTYLNSGEALRFLNKDLGLTETTE